MFVGFGSTGCANSTSGSVFGGYWPGREQVKGSGVLSLSVKTTRNPALNPR
jgi:hypothetical protein